MLSVPSVPSRSKTIATLAHSPISCQTLIIIAICIFLRLHGQGDNPVLDHSARICTHTEQELIANSSQAGAFVEDRYLLGQECCIRTSARSSVIHNDKFFGLLLQSAI